MAAYAIGRWTCGIRQRRLRVSRLPRMSSPARCGVHSLFPRACGVAETPCAWRLSPASADVHRDSYQGAPAAAAAASTAMEPPAGAAGTSPPRQVRQTAAVIVTRAANGNLSTARSKYVAGY
jgi:hypothetical protein